MKERDIRKGYKVFESDWMCMDFQYEVGKTYGMDDSPICCQRGFHYCTKLADCFKYYGFSPKNKVAEIEALGEISTNEGDSKCCTNKIHIVKEISWQEVLEMVNIGNACTGNCNSGNRNSGDWNSGDWNKTNFSNGCFNTELPKIYLFDKPSDWTYQDWINSSARYVLNCMPCNTPYWVSSCNMRDEEKEAHPEHETTGGFLNNIKVELRQVWWNNLSNVQKHEVLNIPNFDKEIFEEITGIDVDEVE